MAARSTSRRRRQSKGERPQDGCQHRSTRRRPRSGPSSCRTKRLDVPGWVWRSTRNELSSFRIRFWTRCHDGKDRRGVFHAGSLKRAAQAQRQPRPDRPGACRGDHAVSVQCQPDENDRAGVRSCIDRCVAIQIEAGLTCVLLHHWNIRRETEPDCCERGHRHALRIRRTGHAQVPSRARLSCQ